MAMTGWCMWCVPFAVGGITRVPTGGRVVCRFIDTFLTCCRVDGGRRRPGGSLLVRRRGTAGRPTSRTVPAPHESRFFASTTIFVNHKTCSFYFEINRESGIKF